MRQRIAWIDELGVDFFNLVHFTGRFASLSAETFLDEVILKNAGVGFLAVGADAHVGKGGTGSAEFIRQRMLKSEADAEVMPWAVIGGARVSSGRIRRLVEEGRMDDARSMLGRPFRYEGRVRRGDQRGTALGFPTMNLPPSDQILPPPGVYATRTLLKDGVLRDSVTNVGMRPTFQGKDQRIETHVLEYRGGDITGERVEVDFISKLRDEKRFESAAALKSQIAADIAQARRVLDECR